MFQIQLNGKSSGLQSKTMPRMTDVVELIKSSIDPAHIITVLRINGRDLTDAEWQSSPTQFQETDILEVETGTPAQFVKDRTEVTPNLLENIFILFRSARQSFQAGDMEEGNKIMVVGVRDLKAFFEWYGMLQQIVPPELQKSYDISDQMEELVNVCKDICEQQLYQSWWALATSIHERLEPSLDRLEQHFRKLCATR